VEGEAADSSYLPWIRKTAAFGLAAALVIVFVSWGGKLALYGNSPVSYSGVHARFGPENTNGKR
jgi:hypothetical protein